ncbi:hypothetical protein [Neobacillus terrae]|uniref:hypothetical protein n=1 Tax=Neobacillus terrae TaxID=3034837 RepID=UPI001408B44B|nr:hypothetical protein [Neobacillus terrae]NHM32457.1 hypothetical protein [Neobacillus terrae]
MVRELFFSFAAFFFMSISAMTGLFSSEEQAKDHTLYKNAVDLTGDGRKENILLHADPYQGKNPLLKKVFIEIHSSNEKSYRIDLDSGFRPNLSFKDLNGDGIKDIFTAVETGGIIQNHLYTLKDFKLEELQLPVPLEMDGNFTNGYKAELTLSANGKTFLFDLSSRNKEYEKLGLYVNGKLNEPTELKINGFHSLDPFSFRDGSWGLRGIQLIDGIAPADSIGIVKTLWKHKEGAWTLSRVSVLEKGR